MTEFTLYLIQKRNSPYRELLTRALASKGMSLVMGVEGKRPPEELSSARAMVILDTSGMDQSQREAAAAKLAGCETGVLLVAPKAEHFFEPAINRLGLVGILVEPAQPAQVRAVVEVARANHLRLAGLRNERDNAQKMLEERLLIEQAVDRLMAERGLKEGEAMRCLQKNALRTNQSVAQVAKAYLSDPASLPNGCK